MRKLTKAELKAVGISNAWEFSPKGAIILYYNRDRWGMGWNWVKVGAPMQLRPNSICVWTKGSHSPNRSEFRAKIAKATGIDSEWVKVLDAWVTKEVFEKRTKELREKLLTPTSDTATTES